MYLNVADVMNRIYEICIYVCNMLCAGYAVPKATLRNGPPINSFNARVVSRYITNLLAYLACKEITFTGLRLCR